MDVRLPDGTIVRNVPDGITKAELAGKLRSNGMNVPDEWMAEPPSMMDKVAQGAGNLAAGAVRGAGSIGATILAPYDIAKDALAGKGLSLESNRQRRADMDGGLQELGAEPDSLLYQGGKLAGEIAGTLPVGGIVGKGLQAAGAARLGTAVPSAGFRTGAPAATTLGGRAADLGVRASGGAISGGATAAAVDPEQAVGGAVIGGVAPGAVKAVERGFDLAAQGARGTYRGARAVVEPFTKTGREAIAGRVLTQAAGDQAAAVAPRLASAAELVPGSAPTAAQVAGNGGIAALERSMAAKNPTPFADRATEQTAARVRAVEDVAGDAGQKEFFGAAREDAAKDLYEKAFAVPLTIHDLTPAMRGEVRKLMAMPAVQEAVKVARLNAKNHGMKATGEGSVAGLHQAKLALDDMVSALSANGASGAQANKAQAIKAARDRLVTFIEKVSPDYAEARATYAAMSQPINQMDVGQELLDKLRPALGEAGAVTRENGESFARALRDGDGLVKKATGRNMPLDQVLTPEQQQVMQNIAADLARKTNAADLARGPGSNTFQNFAVNNIVEQSGVPRIAGALMDVPLLRKIPQALYEKPEGQIQEAISAALLQPRTAAQMITEQIRRQALQSAPRKPMLSDPTRDAIELLFARSSPQLATGQ